MAVKEYFPNIGKIKFEGKDSKNPLAYRYYDADKMILGKPMKEWLKFAMAWWHTLCAEGGDQIGGPTTKFPWNEGTTDAVESPWPVPIPTVAAGYATVLPVWEGRPLCGVKSGGLFVPSCSSHF